LSNGIALEQLSPTFRDFVQIARCLGFNYAWIDSLCIIQEGDGNADWAFESTTMDKVYKNSACNFSADWGSETSGLISVREAREFDQLVIRIGVKETRHGEAKRGCYRLFDRAFWDREVTKAPLNSRGWVLQERLLSPRILHFGRQEVFFECCESSLSEHFPDRMPPLGYHKSMRFKSFQTSSSSSEASRHNHHEVALDRAASYYNAWGTILESYANCGLTFASDKLVAISGIARYLKPFLNNDIYIMGIWNLNMAGQMLWRCQSNALQLRDKESWGAKLGDLMPVDEASSFAVLTSLLPPSNGAPSFSWASVGFSTFGSTAGERGILVTATSVQYRQGRNSSKDEPVTDDLFDFAPSPKVEAKVVGCLKRGRLVGSGRLFFEMWPMRFGNDFMVTSTASDRGNSEGRLLGAHLDFTVSLADVPRIEARTIYYMLWQDDFPSSQLHGSGFQCLLFELVDAEMGRFRRVGITRKSWNKELRERYRDSQSGEGSIPCWSYNGKTREHTIYIV
jgi:hypothetical protein